MAKIISITTGQLAKQLKTSPRRVRTVLRTIPRFQDKQYTRYRLNRRDVDQVKAKVIKMKKAA